MSIDRETNRVSAFVSFRGRAMPSSIVSMAANMTAANAVASNLASNGMSPDMILSVALVDTRISCGSNRDLYSPPDTR